MADTIRNDINDRFSNTETKADSSKDEPNNSESGNKNGNNNDNKNEDPIDGETGGSAKDINEDPVSKSPPENFLEENPPEEELWDLRSILKIPQLLNPKDHEFCNNDGCALQACCIWSSNTCPDEPWYSCLDCQEKDFGGWPEKREEIPLKSLSGEHWRVILERCTADKKNAILPNVSTEGFKSGNLTPIKDGGADPNSEEMWELKTILTPKDLTKPKKQICSTEDCGLVACSAWASNHAPTELWYTCLDCQMVDFEGFPGNKEELPVKFLTEDNRKLILELCTKDTENAELPNLPKEPSLLATAREDSLMATITPPPGFDRAVAENQSNAIVGALKTDKGKKSITPVPGGALKDKGSTKPKSVSKENLAILEKWKAEAVKQGGPDSKIEVSKPKAKKLIFDMLHDSFRPMNITEVYQALKAVVPSPILKACLEDMVNTFQGNPFAEDDGDNEDGEPVKKMAKKSRDTDDQYCGSLRLKEGRNVNNNIYYVDYTKLQNNGNGLDIEKRNDLYADLEKAKCEENALKKKLQETGTETTRLLSEPLNDELATLLVEYERGMEELNAKLETNRAYAGNEKYAKQLNSRVSKMATFWRKRKRQCMEFLMLMEDSTEGVISVKKCLKGDGQICIDSDEGAIAGTIAYAKIKKNSTLTRKGALKERSSGGAMAALNPDPDFVGVQLNSNGNPERVYVGED